MYKVPIQFSTGTIDDLNDNLLSFTNFYEKQNYRCNLGQPGEFFGFYRIDKQGNWIDKVPMTYDYDSHQWVMTVVAAKDFNRAMDGVLVLLVQGRGLLDVQVVQRWIRIEQLVDRVARCMQLIVIHSSNYHVLDRMRYGYQSR